MALEICNTRNHCKCWIAFEFIRKLIGVAIDRSRESVGRIYLWLFSERLTIEASETNHRICPACKWICSTALDRVIVEPCPSEVIANANCQMQTSEKNDCFQIIVEQKNDSIPEGIHCSHLSMHHRCGLTVSLISNRARWLLKQLEVCDFQRAFAYALCEPEPIFNRIEPAIFNSNLPLKIEAHLFSSIACCHSTRSQFSPVRGRHTPRTIETARRMSHRQSPYKL